jgi:hypothetical protein
MTDEQNLRDAVIEALDIEPNATKAQIIIKILRLRAEAARVTEMELEVIETAQQREQAEARLTRVLSGHVRFIGDLLDRARALADVTEEFHEDLSERIVSTDFLDAFDLAKAKLRERQDNGERYGLDEVARETLEEQAEEDSKPLLERLQAVTTDPETSSTLTLGLGADRDPFIEAPTGSPFDSEQLARFREAREQETDTTEHDNAERQPVPFREPEDIKLASDTRDWLVTMAEGGARDDG